MIGNDTLDLTPKLLGPLQQGITYRVTITVGIGNETRECNNSPKFTTSEWICADKTQRIPFDLLCDDTKDCSDGSDEFETICKGDPSILFPTSLGTYFLLGFLVVIPGDN